MPVRVMAPSVAVAENSPGSVLTKLAAVEAAHYDWPLGPS